MVTDSNFNQESTENTEGLLPVDSLESTTNAHKSFAVKYDFNEGNMMTSYLTANLRNKIFNTNKYSVVNTELANFIKSNMSLIKEDETLGLSLFKKIIPNTKILKELMTYEFLYSDPSASEKTNNIDTLLKYTVNELKKYQEIVGGYYIEDINWLLCTPECRFKLKHNQKGIYNSICKRVCDDDDNIWFLEKIVLRMKKYLTIDSNIVINYKIIEDD